VFPVPSPPFKEEWFPADGIALQPRAPSSGHKLHFDCDFLFDADADRAVDAVNACLAQAAAVLDSVVPPQVARADMLAAVGEWLEDPSMEPRTTAHELRQAYSLLRWCIPAGKLGWDPATVELWRHIAGSPLLGARLAALRGLDYCRQAPPLFVIDEAITFLQQEQFVPLTISGWGEQHKEGRMFATIMQRASDWERACEDLARHMFKDQEYEFQCTLQCGLRPDIALGPFERDPQRRVTRCASIIDAKTGETSSIAKYTDYADEVTAWHLDDGPELAEHAREHGDEALAQHILRLSRTYCGPELLWLENLRARHYPED